MARAKRTDRAEARRRYRAYLAEQAGTEEGLEEEGPDAAPAAGRWHFPGNPTATSSAQERSRAVEGEKMPAGRLGVVQAARLAYRQIHYRDDFRFVPTLIFRSNAIWPAVLMVAYGVVVFFVDKNKDDLWVVVATMCVTPFPLLPPMLAGVLAPRAAWLAGIIAGMLSGAAWMTVLIVALPEAARVNPEIGKITGSEIAAYGGQVFLYAITFGALVGAFTGWYKRFLRLTSGPRQSRSTSKTAARRRQTARR